MLRYLLLLLTACSLAGRADDDIGLIRVGENWKYFKGVQEPSEAAGAWKELPFSDSTWLNAFGGVSTPAHYGENTFVYDFGQGYTTLYFRKKFNLPEIRSIGELVLRIDYDDGFIVYLNGHEVARRGAPGEPGELVPPHTYAPLRLRGVSEEINVSAGIPLLQTGDNVLAVQLLGSGTADLTMCFVAELLANFTRAPFIQNTTSNSTQIIWKTLEPSPSVVEFKPGNGLEEAILWSSPTLTTNHVATLNDLPAGSDFLYRVGVETSTGLVFSDWAAFRTFTPNGPVNFSVLGDSGWAISGQFWVADQLARKPTDLIMHVGDVVYYGFSHEAADLRYFSVYAPQTRTTPVFLALGNHDRYLDQQAILQTFYLPTNQVTGTEHYYSFDHGDVHFVALWLDLQASVDYSPGSAQYNWLEQDLRETTKPWKFLFFHHVLRTSGPHWADDYDRNGILDTKQIEESIGVLAGRYGAQIVFNGHDHFYERLAPVGGPMSFISGGGGAVLYPLSNYNPASIQFHRTWHFLNVQVEGEEARVQAVDYSGKIIDTVHVRRAFPERRLYHSVAHRPLIESEPASDGNGNILNQAFDFAGEPIPSKMGAFSSAGRLFVNNDEEFLYLGLDEVMLTASQNLFLFIETPHDEGVNSMEAVGNSLVDPLGQGVDGLDFIANLTFTNFTPSIGVLLGDEAADAAFRDFSRPALPLNIGQGAFFLKDALATLEGQKLQQYNRSPQDAPFTLEQNANFIELAIPYTALNLNAGDRIKVGIVAGREEADTSAAAQTRLLDTGGLGYAAWTDGAKTYLEGVEVQLAELPWRVRVQLLAENRVELRWAATPGIVYRVDFKDDVTHPFEPLPGPENPRIATASQESIELVLEPGHQARFFRVVRLPFLLP